MATETAPAEVAQEPAQPVAAPSAAPTPAEADAASLRAAVAEHAADLADAFPKQAPAAEEMKTDPPAETPPAEAPKEGEAATTEVKPGEKTEDKPEDKPAETEKPPEDAVAVTMAKYVRQHEKAIKREKEAQATVDRVTQERAALAVEMEKAQRAQAVVGELVQLVTTSPIDAIERLLGTEALVAEDSTLVSDLLQRIGARRQGAPVVSEDERIAAAARQAVELDRAERDRLAAEAEAKQKAEKTSQVERSRAAFFSGLQAQFKENEDKYPFLQEEPVDRAEVNEWMQAQFSATGKLPTGDEILGHFEEKRESEALARVAILEKRGKLPARAVASPPPKLPSAATPSGIDVRGQIVKPRASLSLEDQRDEIARQLDQQFRH